MAAFAKFNDYVEQVNRAKHDWASHTFKLKLSNGAPSAANTGAGDITEITPGNGYPAGGMTCDTVTLSESSGVAKVTIADEVLTASGGSIGPFRYVTLYNDTATSPDDAVVGSWDIGSSITLANGEVFTTDFDGSGGVWTMA